MSCEGDSSASDLMTASPCGFITTSDTREIKKGMGMMGPTTTQRSTSVVPSRLMCIDFVSNVQAQRERREYTNTAQASTIAMTTLLPPIATESATPPPSTQTSTVTPAVADTTQDAGNTDSSSGEEPFSSVPPVVEQPVENQCDVYDIQDASESSAKVRASVLYKPCLTIRFCYTTSGSI